MMTAVVAVALLLTGIYGFVRPRGAIAGEQGTASHLSDADLTEKHAEMMAGLTGAVAVLVPTETNECRGVVRFFQHGKHVHITAKLEGLSPGAKHAMHIHEFGDLTSSDGKSAGGHYNPDGHPHALPGDPIRHAGDLGNVQADASGAAVYELTVENLTVAGLKNPIIGRGVIVHAKEDDGGQPTGNAGPRIAMGVIGIAKSD